jgi:GT2 family glycosyltransferase
MILLTGFYLDTDPARRDEFLECIRRNEANDSFDEIHVCTEDPVDPAQVRSSHPPLAAPKVRLFPYGRRLTYRDLFAHANRNLPGRRVVIANADIFFDHTLRRLEGYDLSRKLLCLSRWDVQGDGTLRFFDHPCSQDAWIFRAPISEFFCDFHLGVLGCDNRLAWEAKQAGLEIFNPSRSVRACHLHLSGVRRYKACERLAGSTCPVPPAFLGTPWLWFVVPCMGRLDDLRRCIGSCIGQTRSGFVLVDYSCPDGAGEWVRMHHPDATIVTVSRRGCFHAAEARNQGASVVEDDGILCFLDADMVVSPGFSQHVLSQFEEGSFLVPDREGSGYDAALACSKAAFDRVGGYDEAFLNYGQEWADLRAALRRAGLLERTFSASLLRHLSCHDDARSCRGSMVPDRTTNLAIHAAYRRAKSAILDETGGHGVSCAAFREIYHAIARRMLGELGLTPDVPCATVAFRETMGYTIAKLESGASSHNNDARPFGEIPDVLAGRSFTQVVACSASPVEVEFLASGKLYILVGTDWEGYHPATRWLREMGYREALPPIATRRGTAFEVWSLVGHAGERFVVPTQVMLVAERLVRN